jgi:hypothetical protein
MVCSASNLQDFAHKKSQRGWLLIDGLSTTQLALSE